MEYTAQKFGCLVAADGSDAIHDCDKTHVTNLLDQHGWLLFRGFSPTVDDFARFALGFGICTPVRRAPTSSTAIGYHAEDAYNPFRPDALWFHCVEVGSDEGASTYVCDGERLYQFLSPEIKRIIDGKALRFDRLYSKAEWQHFTRTATSEELSTSLSSIPDLDWSFLSDGSLYLGFETPIISRLPDGRHVFANTLLHGGTDPEFYGMSFSDGSPISQQLVRDIEQAALSIETGIPWKKGDIALLDNRRLLHRRGEYHGTGRDLCVTNCENLFGTPIIELSSPNAIPIKQLIQGEAGHPLKAGWDMAQSVKKTNSQLSAPV